MLAIRSRTQVCLAPRVQPSRPARRSVQVKAEGGFEQQVQKLKEDLDLPVPLEYAYAGVAWGLTLLTWGSPVGFIGTLVILLHVVAAATNVARLGAIARPDQSTGETAAAKALGTGLLFGPFGVKTAEVKEKS